MVYPDDLDYERVMLRFPRWVKKNEKQKWFKNQFKKGFPYISHNQFSFKIKDYLLETALTCALPWQVWDTYEAKEHILDPIQKKLEEEFSTVEDTLEKMGKMKNARDTMFWYKKWDVEDYDYTVSWGSKSQTKKLIKLYNQQNTMHYDLRNECDGLCDLYDHIIYDSKTQGSLPYVRGYSVKEAVESTFEIFSKIDGVPLAKVKR